MAGKIQTLKRATRPYMYPVYGEVTKTTATVSMLHHFLTTYEDLDARTLHPISLSCHASVVQRCCQPGEKVVKSTCMYCDDSPVFVLSVLQFLLHIAELESNNIPIRISTCFCMTVAHMRVTETEQLRAVQLPVPPLPSHTVN